MAYLAELRINWRYLAAACIGLASGFGLNQYVSGTFAPHLLQAFGWTKAQFALTGLTVIVSTIALPIAGRLTDRFGVLRMAPVGVLLTPLFYLAYASMTGSFALFFAINILQTALIGATTTSTVYSRLIAQSFDRSRGLGLSLAAASPAATAAALIPFLSGFIEAEGWRAGYMLLAAGTAVTGAIALFLIPRGVQTSRHAAAHAPKAFRYGELFGNPVFRTILVGVLFANVTHMITAPNLKLILLDHGVGDAEASGLLSLFALGIMIGRLGCGIALDQLPPHIVSAVALGLPGVGIFLLLSGAQEPMVLSAAVLLIGLSTGAEFDVLGFLVMRFFRVEIYSTTYSMIAMVVALSSALGAGLLSLTLGWTNSYTPFLTGGAIATLFGAALFLLLGRYPPVERETLH
jgi:MFS family permease